MNNYTTSDQQNPSVASLSDGKFVITWQSFGQDGSDYGIFGQIFYINGTKFLNEFGVNTYTPGIQQQPWVSSFVDGGFLE